MKYKLEILSVSGSDTSKSRKHFWWEELEISLFTLQVLQVQFGQPKSYFGKRNSDAV